MSKQGFSTYSMHVLSIIVLCILQASAQADYAARMKHIEAHYKSFVLQSLPTEKCTPNNLIIRKEWETLSQNEKQNYISAVQCFRELPKRSQSNLSQSFFDDFVLAHVEGTLNIHFSGFLFPWHRYFLFLYEKALRDECRYVGALPYWDWSKYVASPEDATIFDGSESSMSSNGIALDHGTLSVTLPGGPYPRKQIVRPPGTGGGCIESGPFANYTVHVDGTSRTGLGRSSITTFSRPRCITRDFYLPVLAQCSSYEKVSRLIFESSDMTTFHNSVEGVNCGIHSAGHVFVGGENMDLFSSPNDPVFFLHHANLDRIWAIYQTREPESRMYTLAGTHTFMNYPPSANVTTEDWMIYGDWVEPVRVGAVMSPLERDFCYMYA